MQAPAGREQVADVGVLTEVGRRRQKRDVAAADDAAELPVNSSGVGFAGTVGVSDDDGAPGADERVGVPGSPFAGAHWVRGGRVA